MNTFKTCWMIASLLLLWAMTLLLVQIRNAGRRPTPSQTPQLSTSQTYTYASFQFSGPAYKDSGKTLRAQLVNYGLGPDGIGIRPTDTNSIHGAEEILTEISRDGWEYLWTDGKSYLVRRPAGDWKHPYFLIEYQEESK